MKIEKLKPFQEQRQLTPQQAFIFMQYMANTMGQKINELVDAVNKLQEEKNDK